MPHPHHEVDVWSVEGVLIDTDGVPTPFVTDPHDPSTNDLFAGLRAGQTLVIEGTDPGPSPKGEAAHSVYHFERLASVDGKEPEASPRKDDVAGTVVRLNYAKHGAVNGVVLDNGDFVHTRPDGMERLGLKVGDKVRAEGHAHPLVTGTGRVIEAVSVNGKPVGPAH